MMCLVVRRREKGRAIPSKELDKIVPLREDVHITEDNSDIFGRGSCMAWLFKTGPGPDIIPRLHDARVTGMAQNGMNITGVESIDGVLYSQSWWCRFE